MSLRLSSRAIRLPSTKLSSVSRQTPNSRVMHTFIVYAPDKTDEGAPERRRSVRGQHLINLKKAMAEGLKCKVGGAMFSPESITGGEQKMLGSVLFFDADTIEEVRKVVERDIYYTSGVWDSEKLVIAPFKVAVGSF